MVALDEFRVAIASLQRGVKSKLEKQRQWKEAREPNLVSGTVSAVE
jgi:hypothetical protein